MKKLSAKNFIIKLSAAFFLMFALASCYHVNKDVVPKPEKLIPRDTMVSIIVDINLIDGIVSFNNLNRINNKNLKKEYYERLFLRYGITENELKENMEYYSSEYDEMTSIYDEAIERLTQMQKELKRKEKFEKAAKKPEIPPSPLWGSDSIAVIVDSVFSKKVTPGRFFE